MVVSRMGQDDKPAGFSFNTSEPSDSVSIDSTKNNNKNLQEPSNRFDPCILRTHKT